MVTRARLSLDDIITQEFGTATRSEVDPETNEVGTSIVQILKNDPSRISFSVVNLSGNDVYVAPFPDVGTSKGIRLGPNGGGLSSRFRQDFHMVGYDWYAIASGASSAILTIAVVTS